MSLMRLLWSPTSVKESVVNHLCKMEEAISGNQSFINVLSTAKGVVRPLHFPERPFNAILAHITKNTLTPELAKDLMKDFPDSLRFYPQPVRHPPFHQSQRARASIVPRGSRLADRTKNRCPHPPLPAQNRRRVRQILKQHLLTSKRYPNWIISGKKWKLWQRTWLIWTALQGRKQRKDDVQPTIPSPQKETPSASPASTTPAVNDNQASEPLPKTPESVVMDHPLSPTRESHAGHPEDRTAFAPKLVISKPSAKPKMPRKPKSIITYTLRDYIQAIGDKSREEIHQALLSDPYIRHKNLLMRGDGILTISTLPMHGPSDILMVIPRDTLLFLFVEHQGDEPEVISAPCDLWISSLNAKLDQPVHQNDILLSYFHLPPPNPLTNPY